MVVSIACEIDPVTILVGNGVSTAIGVEVNDPFALGNFGDGIGTPTAEGPD
jgi:hypothetical protein